MIPEAIHDVWTARNAIEASRDTAYDPGTGRELLEGVAVVILDVC